MLPVRRVYAWTKMFRTCYSAVYAIQTQVQNSSFDRWFFADPALPRETPKMAGVLKQDQK